MRIEKISLIIVVICAVIVLAVPFYRGFVVSQTGMIVPVLEESFGMRSNVPAVLNLSTKTDAQLLKENQKDFLLRLALAQEMLDKIDVTDWTETKHPKRAAMELRAKQAISRLLRDYPGEGAVYTLAMRLSDNDVCNVPTRIEGNGIIIPAEIARSWKKHEPPTQEQIDYAKHSIELLDKATAADPGNGFFHYLKAFYLHSLHRDAEAKREMHLSAISPNFTDYNELKMKSMDHLFDLRGILNPFGRVTAKTLVVFSPFSRMREEARIAGSLAYKEIQRGNIDQGTRAALDITDSAYKMTENASSLIQGLVAKALFNIGAATFDPAFKYDDKKDFESQQTARLVRYKKFLIDHGYSREAAILENQVQQTDRLIKKTKAFLNNGGEDYSVLSRFALMLTTLVSSIVVLLLFAIAWVIASLFTMKGKAEAFWDKRAGVTSALISALVLAPVITNLHTAGEQNGWSLLTVPNNGPRPVFLLIPLGIIIIALIAGLRSMLKRSPEEGESRNMPVAALLIAYLASVGGLAYLSFGMQSFANSISNWWLVLTILFPGIAMILYAILRTVHSRFGRVRRNAPLTFLATIRYASAIAVGLFAIVSLCMLILTAHYGIKADIAARDFGKKEAAIIQSSFK